jgi:hypothetical protein
VRGGRRKGGGRPVGSKNKAQIELRDLARQYTAQAVQTLADIMMNGTSEIAKTSAAEKLLDRGWGRPAQPQTGEGGKGPITYRWLGPDDPDPELEQADAPGNGADQQIHS